MNYCALKVRTGLYSGATSNAPRNVPVAETVSVSYGTTPGVYPYQGGLAQPGRLLRSIQAEIDGWLSDPAARWRETIHPRQKVILAERFWELDALRGLSVCMMVAQHIIKAGVGLVSKSMLVAGLGLWNLARAWIMMGLVCAYALTAYFSPRFPKPSARLKPSLGKAAVVSAELVLLIAVVTWLSAVGSGAASFLLVMGVCLTISYSRAKARPGQRSVFPKYAKRGLQMLALAALLTLTSFLIQPDLIVTFGVLHMLAVSVFLAFPFLSLPVGVTLLSGLGSIGAGIWFAYHPMAVQNPLLGVLGVAAWSGGGLDFLPLLPFFGIILLGVVLGKVLYPHGQRAIKIPDVADNKLVEALSWIGEKALPIFMLQEPLYYLGMSKGIA